MMKMANVYSCLTATRFLVPPCVCVGALRVLWLAPTIQRHAIKRLIGGCDCIQKL